MPRLDNHCKHYQFDWDGEKPILRCKLGHNANGRCIVGGYLGCEDYERGLLYSWEEVKHRLQESGVNL